MTTGVVWGGRLSGEVVSQHSGCYSFMLVKQRQLPARLADAPPISVMPEYEVYDFYQRYWPGLGIENLWMTREDFLRVYEQEKGLV